MPEPQSAVWSAIAWDGESSLLAADMHFARIRRHATVLGIQTPDNLAKSVFEALTDLELPDEANDSADQAAFLVIVGVRSNGELYVEPAVIQTWPEVPLTAISLAAPTWDEPVRGTKHAEWGPYRDARLTAIENGADIALLFEEDILVDGDRCAPLLLDHDGVAYYPPHSDGALDSVTIEQIRPGLEAAGIPVSPVKLTLNMILRASEMVVCGSGMGVRAIGSIDGRTIGTPRSRLFQAATDAWFSRLEVGWITVEDI
jgi:branched-subunit amino acid aminotransferase/4-amino-4-deoxychorismate lyase